MHRAPRPRPPLAVLATLAIVLAACTADSDADVPPRIRLGDPARSDYSDVFLSREVMPGPSPARDSALRVLASPDAPALWRAMRDAVRAGRATDAQLALYRLAELRDPAYADSVRAYRADMRRRGIPALRHARETDRCELASPECTEAALLPILALVQFERRRAAEDDAALREELLGRLCTRRERLPDGELLARLGPAAAAGARARFERATGSERGCWFVRLARHDDPRLIPLFRDAFAEPARVGLHPQFRYAAVEGLARVGTPGAWAALRAARSRAIASGAEDDARRLDVWTVQLTGRTVDEQLAARP